MDILDLHFNCQVSLRSKQSKLAFYPDSYCGFDTWPSQTHMSTFMDTDHHRNRHRNAMYPDHSSFHPLEGHYDLQHVSTAQSDHWSAYNYALHPYYHGYGQQEAVEVFQPSPLVVTPQQYYPSWHLPYGSDSGHHGNHDHYGQIYYQTRDSVLYPSVDRPTVASDRQYNPDINSDQFTNYTTSQDDLGKSGQSQYRSDYSVENKSCVQPGKDNMAAATAVKRVPNPRDTHHCVTAAAVPNTDVASFYSKSTPKHPQEDIYNVDIRMQEQPYTMPTKSAACDRPSVFQMSNPGHGDRTNAFQLSSHVRKQERKMKKMLQELQKTDVTKATQLLEFFQFNMAVLQQQYDRYRKDGCDITGQRLTQGDYDFQVQRIIQQVHQKISVRGYRQLDSHKPTGGGEVRKTRLLPKHAVKTLDTWFEENLSNPYPSRDQTLHIALDCGLSIEQVRKWFANKRNRSRNNKLYK